MPLVSVVRWAAFATIMSMIDAEALSVPQIVPQPATPPAPKRKMLAGSEPQVAAASWLPDKELDERPPGGLGAAATGAGLAMYTSNARRASTSGLRLVGFGRRIRPRDFLRRGRVCGIRDLGQAHAGQSRGCRHGSGAHEELAPRHQLLSDIRATPFTAFPAVGGAIGSLARPRRKEAPGLTARPGSDSGRHGRHVDTRHSRARRREHSRQAVAVARPRHPTHAAPSHMRPSAWTLPH